MKKKWLLGLLAVAIVACSVGCSSGDVGENPPDLAPVTPITESYEYTEKSQVYMRPAMTNTDRRLDSLTLTLEDGFYFCITTDAEQANAFINAQRTLLQFLTDSGVETRKLRYYGVDYDDSFSDSENNKAYIALSHVESYRQVLVTLQTLWGDYTDYGYLHAVANAIADHLGWQTDTVATVEQSVLDTFFAENPDALNLVYPCFTTTYADEETVRNCYALSSQLFENINLREALAKPVAEQVDAFRALVDTYAQEISVTFDRQENGYAYYGEYLPLKIMTTYAKIVVDHDFEDYCFDSEEFRGYGYPGKLFANYRSIFETTDIMNTEITASVEYFHLEKEAGVVTINCLNSESAIARNGRPLCNYYYPTGNLVNLTQLYSYLHEYFHHLEYLMNPSLGQCWQSQAFCELGRAQSKYSHDSVEFTNKYDELWSGLFYQFTGRTYESGLDDYYEVYDILTYCQGSFKQDYLKGRNEGNSFNHYLINLYGEDTVYQIMLFPETVEDHTEKTWEELEAQWAQYLKDKYAGIEVPEWFDEYRV